MSRFAVRYVGDERPFRVAVAADAYDLADIVDEDVDPNGCEFAPWRKDLSRAEWKPIVPAGYRYVVGLGLLDSDLVAENPAFAEIARQLGN